MSDKIEFLRRYEPLVDDWAAFAQACEAPLPMVVWANPLRVEALSRLNRAARLPVVDVDEGSDASAAAGQMLAARLRARGYACEELDWYPGGLKVADLDKPGRTLEHHLGLYHVQEEASLVPVRVLDPRPGERILDLCAAPGGKTAQIAIAAGATTTVVANDLRVDRLRALRSNLERLAVLNVAVTAHDGTRFPLEVGEFDRLLLDVPCSCEGNIRQGRPPGFEPPGEFLTGRSGLQATLFGRSWKLLAPGGTLVYATCTFAPEENELVLDHVLSEDDVIEPFSIDGLCVSPGVTEWQGRRLRDDCANVGRFILSCSTYRRRHTVSISVSLPSAVGSGFNSASRMSLPSKPSPSM